jgi:hypothetical protein
MNDFMDQSKATRRSATQPTQEARKPAPAVTTVLTHDDIAKRAYDIYVQKGRQPGQCKQNWLQAERDLRRPGFATGAPQARSAAPSMATPTASR